jgi:proline dehydrogenase
MIRSALLSLAASRTLAERLPRYGFARRAVRRFMPGEDLESALAAGSKFEELGIGSVLTRLGENVEDPAEADAVAAHYHDALRRIGERGNDARISIKPTQLGLDLDEPGTRRRIGELCAEAARYGNEVWIDMESSRYVDRTLAIFRSVSAEHRNVGVCLQAYLHRTAADLEALLETTAAIRLVKGAYDEAATIAYRRRRDVDAAFARFGARLLAAAPAHPERPPPVLASHDTTLIAQILEASTAAATAMSGFEIQMLYGIRTDEQRRLAAEGFRVRVLISYGPAWYPWFMRRLAERPANVWFVARNIIPR